jgi:Flp pilus assembly pilin Flp
MVRRPEGDDGAVMLEYAMMISFVVAVAFAAVQAFGLSVLDLFRSAADIMP